MAIARRPCGADTHSRRLCAPGTYAKLRDLATVKDNEQIPSEDDMLREITTDNESTAATIRSALKVAQDAGEEPSAGLLTDRLHVLEKQLWMMKSMAKK